MDEVCTNMSRIVSWEMKNPGRNWTTDDISGVANTSFISIYLDRGLIRRMGGGRIPRFHSTDRARAIISPGMHPREETPRDTGDDVPGDLLDGIVGLDDVKELIMMVVGAPRPAHLYLWGGPGSAKSAILYSLERLPNSEVIDSTMATRSGIADFLIDRRPRFLIVDEMDKLDGNGYDALLTVMSEGRVIKTKSRGIDARVDIEMPTYVIGAGNSLGRLPDVIISRMKPFIIHLGEYERKESLDMMEGILREKAINPALAPIIARKLVVERDERDPRAAIQLARTCQTVEDVEKALRTLDKYR